MQRGMQVDSSAKRPVAVFDYDGTCLNGQSGALLSTWLMRRGCLSLRTVAGLVWWGLRYKWHLPYRHERARELIFRDLGAYEASDVDALMSEFYHEELVQRHRVKAKDEIVRCKEEGCAVVLISATFAAIAHEAARDLGADGFVATRMEQTPEGRYTGRVLGGVVEGEAKVRAAVTWADEHVGAGCWYLAYAYGDHHTDEELLTAAEQPFAVSPGPTLRKIAERNGWPIVQWKVRGHGAG